MEAGLAPHGSGDVGSRGVVRILVSRPRLAVFQLDGDGDRVAVVDVDDERLFGTFAGHHARRQRAGGALEIILEQGLG